jgi:hypothetical protein
MATETDARPRKDDGQTEAPPPETGTTLNSDSMLYSGMLEGRDSHLEITHDYHLDQTMGESMEMVNANLHLGSGEEHQQYGLPEQQQSAGFETSPYDPSPFAGETFAVDLRVDEAVADASTIPPETAEIDPSAATDPLVNGASGRLEDRLNGTGPLDTRLLEAESETGAGFASSGARGGETQREDPDQQAATDGAIASALSPVTDADLRLNAVNENAASGSLTGIKASADVADIASITYRLLEDAGGLFSIDPVSGIVTVAGALDAEAQGSHEIIVAATASDGAVQTEAFTITVRDVNEYDVGPIGATGVPGEISEHADGNSLSGFAVTASDRDVSDTVSYAIDDPRFTIDDRGIVSIAGDAVFDAETEAAVTFTVTATSSDGSRSEHVFTLNVADENEYAVSELGDTDSSANSIAEDAAAGTEVGITAFAEDTDLSDSVTYSVDDSRFTVDENGVVRVAEGASFDAETEGTVGITVTATSTDGSTSTETFTIAVADVNETGVSAVADTDATANSIAEDTAAGTEVGITAFAEDTDLSDSVTYSVDDSRFTVDAKGVVTVAEGASFDAETEGTVGITVTATSTDGSTSTETFTIAVADVNETGVSAVADNDNAANSIAEDAAAGTQVGITAFAEDGDASDQVTYSVDDSRFTVDQFGVVTVAEGAVFDAETEDTIDLSVTASSTDGSMSTETFEITVNDVDEYDVSPVLDVDQATNAVAENASAGTQVGITASAGDLDTSGQVSFTLSDDRFTIDDAGQVTVAEGAVFDHESEPTIQLTVTAHSTDGSSSQETFDISVSDVAETYRIGSDQTSFTDDGVAEHSITGTDDADTITAHDDGGTIYSGAGDDMVHGGAGDDYIIYGEGADTVYGGGGDDFVDDEVGAEPNMSDNLLDGGAGNDTIYAGGGNDTLIGGDGNDRLYGEDDNDTLQGDAGNDSLYGESGDDIFIGGTGNDFLSGGSGSDLFMHGLGDGSDTISGGSGYGWTDVIDLGGGHGATSAGEPGTDWTVTVTRGHIEGIDSSGGTIDLSRDAGGYIDFADGSRVTFTEIEEIRW